MEGTGYNPAGFEPDAHERFSAPSEDVLKVYVDQFKKKIRERRSVSYEEVQEYRKRGESHILGHYAYEMMFDIYAGIEDEYMDGAIDSHLHIYPDYVPRSIDIIQLAIKASEAKMRAVVCKDHFFLSTGQAWSAQWVVDQMVKEGKLERACKVFGTYILAWSHHPEQIHLVRKYPNLGGVYFWTFTGGHPAGPPLEIHDGKGKLLPDVKECIRLCAEYKIPIFTGHKWVENTMPMVEYATEVGAHILVTHAGGSTGGITDMAGTIEQAKRMAKLGAFLEVGANKFLPTMMWPLTDTNASFDWIKEVGAEHCVANTDFGQVMVS